MIRRLLISIGLFLLRPIFDAHYEEKNGQARERKAMEARAEARFYHMLRNLGPGEIYDRKIWRSYLAEEEAWAAASRIEKMREAKRSRARWLAGVIGRWVKPPASAMGMKAPVRDTPASSNTASSSSFDARAAQANTTRSSASLLAANSSGDSGASSMPDSLPNPPRPVDSDGPRG